MRAARNIEAMGRTYLDNILAVQGLTREEYLKREYAEGRITLEKLESELDLYYGLDRHIRKIGIVSRVLRKLRVTNG